MSPNRCSSFRLRPGSHLASAQSKRRLLAHNVRPVSSVDAADDGRCLQYSAIARGSAFSRSPNSVLGRRPRAHSSTGEACATFARRRMAVWVRRVRRRPLPVSKWRLVRTHMGKPQPPEFARRAHAIARPWPPGCRIRPSPAAPKSTGLWPQTSSPMCGAGRQPRSSPHIGGHRAATFNLFALQIHGCALALKPMCTHALDALSTPTY